MTADDRTVYNRAAEGLRARFRREEDALRSEGYLTVVDAAQALGVTRNTVSAMIADGRLHVRPAGRIAGSPEQSRSAR